LSILLFASCSEYLNINPYSAVAPESITQNDLPALERGMYYSVQNDPGRTSWVLFDLLGANLTGSSGNPSDVINSILNPLHSDVGNNWNGLYRALYQVNNVISIADDVPEGNVRNRVKGTAHYFRGFIYYSLVTRWGDVPLLRTNTLELVTRDPASEVWTFIEEELEQAMDLLGTSESYYYVSKDAAVALLARAKLAQNKLPEAAALAEQLITSGRYRLDSFEKIFRKQFNSEIIFAFENLTEESSNNLSSQFYTYAHPNKGGYFWRPAPETLEMFEEGDKRKDISITDVAGSYVINKYPSGQTGTDPINVSRIAEMYLISAEAKGRVNGLARLNELRNFRGLPSINPASDEAFITAILDERRKELLAEGFRYYDLIRTGRAKEELGLFDHQLVLPIPGRELLQNPNLEPNPGY
ncbi:MAG TPA: RagB/SusD family nutrient uptake outer membrane protein, partial [Mariniphaga sp.]|nr:RagB/SusD family nutrient uptake outer membrane protein [Mariniphaga sp.]